MPFVFPDVGIVGASTESNRSKQK